MNPASHASGPVNPDQALPDAPIAPTVLIADALTGESPAGAEVPVEVQRHAAYHAAFGWGGKALHPYTNMRQYLFETSRRFLPLGGLKLPEEYRAEFIADAYLLLFLCSSSMEELRDIRHSADLMIDRAFEWADVHVHPADKEDAGQLAFKILRQAEINIAVPQPSGTAQREGN